MSQTRSINNKREQVNITLFAVGKAVSIFGSSIYTFAIGLYVLKLTGSALSFATTLMLGIVPMILASPFAGVLTDKMSKKYLIIGMDVANGLLFLFVYFIAINQGLSLPLIYISTALLGVFSTFFGIAMEAVKPNLVVLDKLLRLNALSKLIDSLSSIIGPLLGGIVFALLDIKAFILFNGISFLISALTECFIDYEVTPTTVNHDEDSDSLTFVAAIKEGGQYLFTSKSLLEMFFIFAILNFVLGFSIEVPIPYILNNLLNLSPNYYGIINGLFPVGMILGALTVERLMKKIHYSSP